LFHIHPPNKFLTNKKFLLPIITGILNTKKNQKDNAGNSPHIHASPSLAVIAGKIKLTSGFAIYVTDA